MNKRRSLIHYDVKVLLALVKSIKGDRIFFKYLAENGYIELAAWSNCMRGDIEALKWLFNSGYLTLVVLSNAIDGEKYAVSWIERTKDEFLINFAAACRGDEKSFMWFRAKNLQIFIYMITEIKEVLKVQVKDSMFWYRWKW